MPQRRLGRTVQDTRELVANGDLPLVPGTTSMVYPADVAAITQKVVNRPIRRPPGLDGYIDTAQPRGGSASPFATWRTWPLRRS
jgi:hypothetical protein